MVEGAGVVVGGVGQRARGGGNEWQGDRKKWRGGGGHREERIGVRASRLASNTP